MFSSIILNFFTNFTFTNFNQNQIHRKSKFGTLESNWPWKLTDFRNSSRGHRLAKHASFGLTNFCHCISFTCNNILFSQFKLNTAIFVYFPCFFPLGNRRFRRRGRSWWNFIFQNYHLWLIILDKFKIRMRQGLLSCNSFVRINS